jgi:hypothetical protein
VPKEVESKMPRGMDWKWLVLKSIADTPRGIATLQDDIYPCVEPEVQPELLNQQASAQGRPRYQGTVRSFLSDLMQEGLVERVKRATYKLTDVGKQRLHHYLYE